MNTKRVISLVVAVALLVTLASTALAEPQQGTDSKNEARAEIKAMREEIKGDLEEIKALREKVHGLWETYRRERKEFRETIEEARKNKDLDPEKVRVALDYLRQAVQSIAKVKDEGDANHLLRIDLVEARMDKDFEKAESILAEVKANLEDKSEYLEAAISYVEQAQAAVK
ncbi:MAG: hypothetical protein HPY55_15580 [Firmicutes bacterium]|nr:hypothetical protein [Bacillota bacterium]